MNNHCLLSTCKKGVYVFVWQMNIFSESFAGFLIATAATVHQEYGPSQGIK